MSTTEKAFNSRTLYLTAFILGIYANLSQAALFRFFMGQFYGTEIHLSLFLSLWLAGIAVGAYLSGKFKFTLNAVIIIMALLPLCAIATIYAATAFLTSPEGAFLSFEMLSGFMFISVVPVSFFVAMFMPIAIRLSQKSMGGFYSIEAFGSFIGGIFFSLLMGGTPNSIITLSILPLLPLSALFVISPHKKKLATIILLFPYLAASIGPILKDKIETSYWQKFHPLLKLEKTIETPYQKLQLGTYHEMNILYSNGVLAESWPLPENSESRVHLFITSLEKFAKILVIGAPSNDLILEFLKYKNLELTIVENDKELIEILDYSMFSPEKINIELCDPRSYLNHSNHKFDGIFISPVSPVTISGNRLFTINAFREAKRLLNESGVIHIQIAGGENYLDNIQHNIMLTTWHAMQKTFNKVFAIPGNNITFLGCNGKASVPPDAAAYARRYSERKIETSTFQAMSFYNIFMPFRVDELNQWLAKVDTTTENTDTHPGSFMQQLELWNIYSGNNLNRILAFLKKLSLSHLYLVIFICAILTALTACLCKKTISSQLIIGTSVAISGASGLLCEIILILAYQNRFGAAYQMTAMFFGIYMLGLAVGSRIFANRVMPDNAIRKMKLIKSMQIVFTILAIAFIDNNLLHNSFSIGLMIFTIAFLDGIEFPIAEAILNLSDRKAQSSAGFLLLSDSSGAMFAGLISSLWLLPAFGMKNSISLLTVALLASLAIILIFQNKLQKS